MNSTLDMQSSLLGAYLKDRNLFAGTEHLVRKGLFTTAINQESYEVIHKYHLDDKPIDVDMLFFELKKKGYTDFSAIASYHTSEYVSEYKMKEYVVSLFSDYTARYLTPILSGAIQNVASDPMKQIELVKTAINNIEAAVNNVSSDKGAKAHYNEAVRRIKELKSGEIKQPGFSWGLKSLDEKTIGIVQGVNVLAGDKGCGKTSLLINIIRHNAIDLKLPLLFFSLEMSAIEIMTNLIANIKRINSRSLRTGNVDDDDIRNIERLEPLIGENLVIDQTGGITWQYFETKIKAHRRAHKIPADQPMLVLLDYLQLMKNPGEDYKLSKEERMENTCNEIMRVCKNENVALVKLSQFSRDNNKRGNDTYLKTNADRLKALRPRLSDLKGTSAIESNAVQVIMLFRPEYYKILESDGKNLRGLCEANIAKGRYVDPSPLYLNFDGRYNLFSDIVESNDIVTGGDEAF